MMLEVKYACWLHFFTYKAMDILLSNVSKFCYGERKEMVGSWLLLKMFCLGASIVKGVSRDPL
jgi:hypothetical protein